MASLQIILSSVVLAAAVAVAVAQEFSDPKTAHPVVGISQSAENLPAGGAESSIGQQLGKPQGWALDAVELKAKATALIESGEEPIRLKNWINSQLLPQAKQTAMELQGQVDGAQQKIEQCKEFLWSAEKEVKHRESILEEDESQRFQCVANEHRLHKMETDTCGDLDALTKLVVANQPRSLGAITNKTVDEVETVLRKNWQFVKDFNQNMIDHDSACTAAKAESDKAHAECLADESVIEEFYCTMRYGRDQSCEQYDGCFKKESDAFDQTVVDVRALEAHTKEQFKKLTCFERKIQDEGVAQTSADCDPDALSVAHLTVSYPAKPIAKTCVAVMTTRRDLTSLVECKAGSVIPHSAITVDNTDSSTDTSTLVQSASIDNNNTQQQSSGDANSSSKGHHR